MSALHAGLARAIITPPIGIPMVGFAGRGPAEAVHDDLSVTALALQSGEARAVILALDLLGVSASYTAAVREEIARRTGLPPEGVLLCASHTHYGPATDAYGGGEQPPDVAAYLANLKFLLAGASQAAIGGLEPVRIGVGTGSTSIGVNRRERLPDGQIILGQNPAGACDREVLVVRIERDSGEPMAAVVNAACHPVSAASQMKDISSDYVGVMRELVESNTGAACLFVQGAAGNINPVEMRHSFEPARRLGVILGGEVLKTFESTSTSAAHGLALMRAEIDLPAMSFASEAEGERTVAELRANLDRLRERGVAEGSIYWAASRLQRAEKMLDAVRGEAVLAPVEAEICSLQFGEVALVTAPGEIFCETGMEIKRRSPAASTLYGGYANGTIGYVPTPASYPEGGYEVSHACRVGPDAAGMIEKTSLQLLAGVRR